MKRPSPLPDMVHMPVPFQLFQGVDSSYWHSCGALRYFTAANGWSLRDVYRTLETPGHKLLNVQLARHCESLPAHP